MDSQIPEDGKKAETVLNKKTVRIKATGRTQKLYEKMSIYTGLPVLLVSTVYVLLQFARCSYIPQNLACTYIAFTFVLVGLGLFLLGLYPYLISRRRRVRVGELNDLYGEVDSYGNKASNICKLALEEKGRLLSYNQPVFEIDVLPLRKLLVDLYNPEHELIAKARRELGLLNEYTSIVDIEEGKRWNKRINDITSEMEKILNPEAKHDESQNGADRKKELKDLKNTLRSDLKTLRETVAWYDQTWAIGEKLKDCVTCWVAVAAVVTMFVGILPIVHHCGNWNLCIAHWAVLGATGALLSITLRLHRLDLPELGETAGYDLLQGTIRSIVIGALTSVLLYAAIWGQALDGQIFPDLPTGTKVIIKSELKNCHGNEEKATNNFSEQVLQDSIFEEEAALEKIGENVQVFKGSLKDLGLSIFWAIFAGLSPVILRRMSNVVESSLGDLKNTSGIE